MAFNINDKVICIKPAHQEWTCTVTGKILYPAPKCDEILIIDDIHSDGYLVFNKYSLDNKWYALAFRKLDYDFAEEVMKSIIEQPIEIEQL